MTVANLQDKFNECFPNFKIEFYPDIRAMKAGRPADGGCLVQHLNKKHDNGELRIKSLDSTEKVRHELKNRFGLHAKIFRSEAGKFREMDVHEHLAV